MNPPQTIREGLLRKNNDYSKYEPFHDCSPIGSSIIVPVYNGARILRRTLENLSQSRSILENQNVFEITVVDDGSEEDIRSEVDSVQFACPKYYIRQDANKGRGAARNLGLQKASKELLFFFDADVLLPSNYFEKMWAIHNSVDNAIAVGLAENVYSDERISKNADPKQINPKIFDDFRYYKRFSDAKFGRKEYWLMEETDAFKNFGLQRTIGPWTLPKMVVTHNVSVRRNHALGVGGFSEKFKTWGYEDAHFGARLIASGCYVIPSLETGIIRILQRDKNRSFSDENRDLYERLLDEDI